jgi:hypothetical protein
MGDRQELYVFTICFNDDMLDKKEALKKTAKFMLDYSDKL